MAKAKKPAAAPAVDPNTAREKERKHAMDLADDEGAAFVDASDANAATDLYRKVHAGDWDAIVFHGIWQTHPTWSFVLADECWNVVVAPPQDGPGGLAFLRRKK